MKSSAATQYVNVLGEGEAAGTAVCPICRKCGRLGGAGVSPCEPKEHWFQPGAISPIEELFSNV